MEISDDILCLFSSNVEQRGDEHVIEIPDREVTVGDVSTDGTYRVAILRTGDTGAKRQHHDGHEPSPPVEENEERTVDIEGIGDQGDGIARVERGYVLIVPDTEKGERVTVRVTDVRENLAFTKVVDRQDFYE